MLRCPRARKSPSNKGSIQISSKFVQETGDIKVEGINVDMFVKNWERKKFKEMTYLVGNLVIIKVLQKCKQGQIISKLRKVFIDKLYSH